mgnify:CR=1 FL=1
MITVKEVKTKKDIKAFLDFPLELYKNCEYFVPPLYGDEKKMFSKNFVYNDTCESVFFLAESDGKILGYAFCIHKQFINDNNMTDVKTLYIDDLCVDENERGKHIGKTLYDFVVSYAKKNGYYNVTLNVWADNKKAVGFYEKIGLQVQKIGMEKIL